MTIKRKKSKEILAKERMERKRKERIQRIKDRKEEYEAERAYLVKAIGYHRAVTRYEIQATPEEMQEEMRIHAEFFKGKTPAQEYEEHTARRNALKQQFEDELI